MSKPTDAPLSSTKRLLGLAALLVVIVGGMWIGLSITRGSSITSQPAGSLPPIILYIFGAFFLFIGVVAYSFVLVTGCFIFSLARPYYRKLRPRIVIANIVVPLFFQAGFSFMMAPTVERIAAPLLPESFVIPAAFLAPFVLIQIGMIWLLIWGPLERILIRRRARAQGMTPQQIAAARMIGISDPAKSSFRRFGGIEEDQGLLFIADDRLGYRGDDVAFDILRDDLLDIERKTDAGATSSYFGAVHVILVVRQSDGSTRRIRLHPEGLWTMMQSVRALDDIAETIGSWKQNVPRSTGFPVASVGTAASPTV